MQILPLAIFGYLIGSIPTGKIVGILQGVDIQKKGSGNIGFANVRRVLGWPSGIFVLTVDIFKGFIPVYVAGRYFNIALPELLLVCVMPILGHAYPVWLNFKGGKSISTIIGVYSALNIVLSLSMVCFYLAVVAAFKKSALGSLAGVWVVPLVCLLRYPDLVIFTFLVALFATYTHRQNIMELRSHAH